MKKSLRGAARPRVVEGLRGLDHGDGLRVLGLAPQTDVAHDLPHLRRGDGAAAVAVEELEALHDLVVVRGEVERRQQSLAARGELLLALLLPGPLGGDLGVGVPLPRLEAQAREVGDELRAVDDAVPVSVELVVELADLTPREVQVQRLGALGLEGLGRQGPPLEGVDDLPVHEALEVEDLTRRLDDLDGLLPHLGQPREHLPVLEPRLGQDPRLDLALPPRRPEPLLVVRQPLEPRRATPAPARIVEAPRLGQPEGRLLLPLPPPLLLRRRRLHHDDGELARPAQFREARRPQGQGRHRAAADGTKSAPLLEVP